MLLKKHWIDGKIKQQQQDTLRQLKMDIQHTKNYGMQQKHFKERIL